MRRLPRLVMDTQPRAHVRVTVGPNCTPHADAREAACQLQTSQPRAGGRGR